MQVVLPAILVPPREGCVHSTVWQGLAPVLVPGQGLQGLEPLVLCLQTLWLGVGMDPVRFSGGWRRGRGKAKGEKEERQGVG